MTDILVTSPFRPFTLPTQFKAVFNGSIYCGTVDAVDPSVSQVQVYLVNESGDKVPVTQPLRTNAGGFLVYNGQPAKFVTDSNHSLLVRDSLGSQLWYAPNMAEIDPAAASFLAIEALRRSYAEVGYNLVDGSFEAGGTLVNANDVLLQERTGKAFSGPAGKVAAGTDPTSGGFVDRSQETAENIIGARSLAHYGSDSQALLSLLTFAKTTGKPVYLTSDVEVPTAIDIDFAGAKLTMYFNGFSILSDGDCLTLRHLAEGSNIVDPNIRNITTPWVISRWDAAGNWISPVLSQSNGPRAYMPTGNDSDIWGSLTPAQQSQTISPRMVIANSDRVNITRPKGRFALYQFDGCNHCLVLDPDIESGGKGYFGTILFANIYTSGYGIGNKVVGGTVRYGSFSGVVFMRNKRGGVSGGFIPYRNGESGVKTYQGEVAGRSARCYAMEFDGIYPHQTYFDGVDFCSDFGSPAERVDDYTLAQYPWNELPTKHTVRDIISYGCKHSGIWGNGRLNDYSDIRAELCGNSGIRNIGKYQYFNNLVAVNNNMNNNVTGEHQVTIPSANSINGVRVIVEAATNIVNGFSLYAPESYASDVDVSFVDNTNVRTVLTKGDILAKRSSNIGDGGDNVTIGLIGRLGQLQNPIGQLGASVTVGLPGSEGGDAFLKGVSSGTPVHGLRASGSFGGCGILATASAEASGGGSLLNGELGFYFSGTQLKAVYKDPNGIVSNYTFTPG